MKSDHVIEFRGIAHIVQIHCGGGKSRLSAFSSLHHALVLRLSVVLQCGALCESILNVFPHRVGLDKAQTRMETSRFIDLRLVFQVCVHCHWRQLELHVVLFLELLAVFDCFLETRLPFVLILVIE